MINDRWLNISFLIFFLTFNYVSLFLLRLELLYLLLLTVQTKHGGKTTSPEKFTFTTLLFFNAHIIFVLIQLLLLFWVNIFCFLFLRRLICISYGILFSYDYDLQFFMTTK
jgi:hypothetical protein